MNHPGTGAYHPGCRGHPRRGARQKPGRGTGVLGWLVHFDVQCLPVMKHEDMIQYMIHLLKMFIKLVHSQF